MLYLVNNLLSVVILLTDYIKSLSKNMRFLIISILLFFSFSVFSQNTERIVFYNVENFFDTFDELNKSDEAYLPSSDRHWTYYRYKKKLSNLARVIVSITDSDLPVIIGLAEIENSTVLNDIVNNSSLASVKYEFLHKESPDQRGIDVAMLYLPTKYLPLKTEFLQVCLSEQYNKYTRDILYSLGVLNGKDTVHLFINHWSSRLGGKNKTQRKRIKSAKTLALKINSIFNKNSEANIIVMGDFNDTPKDYSIRKSLCANCNLINKSIASLKLGLGTLKYKAHWDIFDQIIVSKTLKSSDMRIFKAPFLLEEDVKYGGFRLKRTYRGMRYNDGFSDHLPVYIDLYCQ